MKLCSVCNKNIATVFTAKMDNGKPEMVGLCIKCAKDMGLPVVEQLFQQMGVSPEEIDNYTEQINEMLQNMNPDEINNNMFANIMGGINPEVKKDSSEPVKESKSQKEREQKQTKTKAEAPKPKRKYLDTYGTNLTDSARNNKIDRVIGRNNEIDRVIQILNRRTKNNPVLIGEPGVGKTAIAEGLAVRIAEKQVPAKLYDAELYLLDLTGIVAGTQFRGQFEGRMKSIVEEAKESGNIILVIDEIHNIIGAGEAQGGAINAANILKPALAKGEIQVIGATTLEEYRKYIEKDSALERRFQPVMVDEPTISESIEILKGIRHYYEGYHKVRIPDETIDAAVNMSERYITDRFLPDKAIDVIDEAGSRVNLRNESLTDLESCREKLKKLIDKMEEAAVMEDYEKAAEYKTEELRLQEKIKSLEKECSNIAITVEDVAYVIEGWTKIPVQSVTEAETEKLLKLEEKLHTRVIGQDEAITGLARAIRRNRIGFRKKKKPSSFIFVGPTGVGKTELVKALSCELFGSEESLIRIDMSEYMEKHTVSKLIGAPPGYVGYDEGGQLTERVRRKPYSVILMDEIEKAHPDVFNMLLQILEDGRLTDSQGRTVNFENTVIIMTSNAGTSFKTGSIGFAGGYSALENHVKEALKEIFRPEFLNRVDETIVFKTLTREELRRIVDLMLKEVIEEVAEKGIGLEIMDEVKEYIIEKGNDEKYGARPLRRTIQRLIEDEVAELYLHKKISEGSVVKASMGEDKILFNMEQ